MAKKDERKQAISSGIMSKLWSLRKQMNGVYKDTYSEDQKKAGSMAFVTSDTTEFKIFGSNYVELHPSTFDILALERADGREYFEMMFQE